MGQRTYPFRRLGDLIVPLRIAANWLSDLGDPSHRPRSHTLPYTPGTFAAGYAWTGVRSIRSAPVWG